MRSTCVQAMFLAALLLVGTAETDELEIFERPAPAQQQRPYQVEVAPTETSITGERVVSIRLDDTGIQDWRFMNPRKPQSVNANAIIQFENQTADRIFEDHE